MTKGMSIGIARLVVDALRKCAEDGMTTTEAAEHLGISHQTARRYEVQHGIKFKLDVSTFDRRYKETTPYTERGGMVQFALRLSPDAYSHLCDYAKRDDISVAAAARKIIEEALSVPLAIAAE